MTALMEGELEHRDRAVLDPLTGLLNRASLDSRVLEIEEQAHLTGGAVSLILLDLDRFKRVNDTYGHERGDAVLRDAAYEIRKSLRELRARLPDRRRGVPRAAAGRGPARGAEIAERVRHSVEEARPGDLDLTDLGRRGRRRRRPTSRYDVALPRRGRRAASRPSGRAATAWRPPAASRGSRSRGIAELHGDPSAVRA